MKTCFKCGVEKPRAEFYKHKRMGDGLLGKCKDCTKSDVTSNRKDKIEYYRAYDRKRGSRRTPEKLAEYRAKYPNKYRAKNMVNNAVRDGKLFREPCATCGTADSVHAHHDDYAKPLNVRWLCAVHHREWHEKNGEGLNG